MDVQAHGLSRDVPMRSMGPGPTGMSGARADRPRARATAAPASYRFFGVKIGCRYLSRSHLAETRFMMNP